MIVRQSRSCRRVSDATSTTDTQIQILQRRVTTAKRDYAAYDGLGSAFFQKARETGDITYYELAAQTLKKALDLAPQDFRSALILWCTWRWCAWESIVSKMLSDMRKRQSAWAPETWPAFAIEGDAYTDMGDYDEAEGSLQHGAYSVGHADFCASNA